MSEADRYVMLMASLPDLGTPFSETHASVSRFKLEQRLRLLESGDARLLAHIERVIAWNRQEPQMGDASIFKAVDQLLEALQRYPGVADMIARRMEMRTLVAALRKRKRGDPAPAEGMRWGYGSWLRYISRHWAEPAFGMELMVPWLPEVARQMELGESLHVERLLVAESWRRIKTDAQGHYFDFHAVVAYVLLWSIVDRWTRYAAKAASERFARLVEQGLKDVVLA